MPTLSQNSTESHTLYLINANNLKHNQSWGPELQEERPDGIFQIYFQNLNSFICKTRMDWMYWISSATCGQYKPTSLAAAVN
jgi:hypothetical protein